MPLTNGTSTGVGAERGKTDHVVTRGGRIEAGKRTATTRTNIVN